MEALLELKIDPNGGISRKRPGSSPLHVASANGMVGAVELLLGAKGDVNIVNTYKATPAHAAAGVSSDALRLLVCAKAAIDARDGNTQAPLHVSARMGELESMKILIDGGSKVSLR